MSLACVSRQGILNAGACLNIPAYFDLRSGLWRRSLRELVSVYRYFRGHGAALAVIPMRGRITHLYNSTVYRIYIYVHDTAIGFTGLGISAF